MDDSTGRVAATRRVDPALPEDVDARAVEIRAEIAETRGEISETIHAIEERLTPAHLAQQATDTVRNAATGKVRQMVNNSFVDSIRDNPVPSAMVGLGIVWLLAKRRSSEGGDYAYGEPYGNRGYGRSDRAGYGGRYDDHSRAVGTRGGPDTEQTSSLGSSAREAIGGLTERAQDAASDVRDAARRTTRRAQLRFNDVLENNPLILGAAAALIGAVVGMSVPSTDAENQLMGDARDAVVDRAREIASSAADRVSDAAGTVEQLAGQVKDRSKDLAR